MLLEGREGKTLHLNSNVCVFFAIPNNQNQAKSKSNWSVGTLDGKTEISNQSQVALSCSLLTFCSG